MLSANLKTELSWFGAGIIAAFLVGLLISWPTTMLCLYLTGFSVWQLYRLDTIAKWLRKGAKTGNAPNSSGLTDEIVELVHREKKYSRKQKNRYRSTLALFNSLAAELPDATIVVNADNEIRWSNSAALKLFNIRPEKDRGQRVDNLVRVPEFREFLLNTDQEHEVEITGLTDPERTLSIRKVHTEKNLTVLIGSDITQRVKVREMRKAFVGDVSHELRTPLTVIRGYLEMLQDNPSLDNVAQSALQEVDAQSQRMRDIVDDLLQLSRLESNPLGQQEGEAVDISAMARQIVKPLAEQHSKHTFTLDCDPSLALLGSEREIYSVCDNLLSNALKYTDPGATITITWQQDEFGNAVFSVQDNGLGIEARHLPRISERFYRVDSARSREEGGTGLGLAIVKHVVQRHGGTLDIESIPGSGSTFTASFPAIRTVNIEKDAVAKVANQ